MKTKNSRKGFTIVELVITISVIGVLAAILIPTFISLTQKAEKRSDDSLVTNLNKALAIKESEPGAKDNVTFHDAIVDLDEYGYGVAKLITHSDEKLVWNPGDNRFYLEGDEKLAGIPAYKLWGIYDSVPATQKYSIYPGVNWTATTVEGLKVGFDAGDEPVTSISYVGGDSAQEVYIRTNSLDTSVTVNAPNDIVWHYDVAGSVNVVSVDGSSYHELGTVPFLEVAGGNIVFGSEAKVSNVHFTASGEGSAAKFESEGRKISLDFSALSEEQLPKFTRDPIAIADNGTYVAKVTDDSSTDYIWLFGAGVQEQMVVTDTADAIAENGEIKEGVTMGTEDGTVAAQIANAAERNEDGELVDETGAVISMEDLLNDPTKAVITKDGDDKEDIKDLVVEEAITEEAAAEAGEEVDWSAFEARIGKVGYVTLRDAVNAATSGQTVTLLKNVDVGDRLAIVGKSLTIYGGHANGNYSITASNENITDGRCVNVTGDNANVTLRHLDIIGPTSGSWLRGLNIGDSHVTVLVDYCNISCKMYAINAIKSCNHLDLTIKNSTITGWAAINHHGSSGTIKVQDSSLIGINTYSGTSNAFSTIVIDGNSYVDPDSTVSDNEVAISNSTIVAEQRGDQPQSWISFQYGANGNSATVSIDGNTKILDAVGGNSKVTDFYMTGENNFIRMKVSAEDRAALIAKRYNVTDNADGTVTVTATGNTIIYAWPTSSGLSGEITQLWTPFVNGWLESGEYIFVTADTEFNGDDVVCQLTSGSFTFIVNYQGEHSITGTAHIVLKAGVTAISDSELTIFTDESGNVIVPTVQVDGDDVTYLYAPVAA